MTPFESEIASLQRLAIDDLRIAWRRVHGGEPPARLSGELRAQEQCDQFWVPAIRVFTSPNSDLPNQMRR